MLGYISYVHKATLKSEGKERYDDDMVRRMAC